MDERDFFLEARAQKPATLNCPFCRSVNEYALAWMVRKKRTNINVAQLDERDRAKFEKAQSYMVLLDDHATCLEPGCRRRFEVSGVKTMAFVTPEQLEEIDFGSQSRRDGGQRQGARGGRPRTDGGNRGHGGGPSNRDNIGNRSNYGNRDAQSGRGQRQFGESGQQGGKSSGNRGKQPNRGGNAPAPFPHRNGTSSRARAALAANALTPRAGWRLALDSSAFLFRRLPPLSHDQCLPLANQVRGTHFQFRDESRLLARADEHTLRTPVADQKAIKAPGGRAGEAARRLHPGDRQ